MAFIPIHARADQNATDPVSATKKGKLTPEQAAVLNSFTLYEDTGILDFGGKCKENRQSYANNIITIYLSKGYIAICGRLVEVEENTTVIINTNLFQSGKIVARFDLSQPAEGEFSVNVVNANYNPDSDDLNENPINGKYDLVLYDFVLSQQGTYATLTQKAAICKGNKQVYEKFQQILGKQGISISVLQKAPLQGYDTSKGTIEERLNNLEPIKSSINFCGIKFTPIQDYDYDGIYREANFVNCVINKKIKENEIYLTLATLNTYIGKINTTGILETLDEKYRPKKTQYATALFEIEDSPSYNTNNSIAVLFEISTNGVCTTKQITTQYLGAWDSGIYVKSIKMNFGYEANPL